MAPETSPRAGLPTMRALARRAVVPLLVLVVAASLGSALLSQSSRLDEFEWRFSPGWVAVALVSLVAYQVALFGVWVLLMRDLGVRLPWRTQGAIWNTSLLARYVPTSALMTVVRVGLYEREGVGRRTTLVASVYELLLQLAVAVIVGAWWLLSMAELEGHPARWLLLAVPVAGLAFLHPKTLRPFVAVLLRRFGREGEPVSLPFGRVLAVALAYIGCFMIAGVGVLAVARSLHPVAGDDVPLVMASFAIAFVVSVLAFVLPGGLGARETALATALAPALPFAVALAVAVVLRIAQIALELVFASVASMVARRAGQVAPEPPAGPARPAAGRQGTAEGDLLDAPPVVGRL